MRISRLSLETIIWKPGKRVEVVNLWLGSWAWEAAKGGFYIPCSSYWLGFNPVPVDKKQGTIQVCIDFRDLNKACLKDNYPTPFIDQIIDECAVMRFFPSWMVFRVIIKFLSILKINIRQPLYVPGVPLHIERCLLVLKMLEPLFSGPCHMLSTTSNMSLKHTWMISLLVLERELITLVIFEWFSSDVVFIKSGWIPTSAFSRLRPVDC